MPAVSRSLSPQPRHAIVPERTEPKAAPPASSGGTYRWTLGDVNFFVSSQIRGVDSPARGSDITRILRQVKVQSGRFSIESKPQHGGGKILTCRPLAKPNLTAAPSVKLYINPEDYLTQAEVCHPVERDRYGNGKSLRTTVAEFHVPSTAASVKIRPPAWTAALQVSAEGKVKGRPFSLPNSPTSLGHPSKKRRIDEHGAVSPSTVSRNRVQSFHDAIPLDWPAEVRAAALSITYFEKQSEMRCLQHAYNNALGAPLFQLGSDLATHGSDIGLVCSDHQGAPQPLQRLVLDHGQLGALIPVLAEHLSQMIVFRGNLSSGTGTTRRCARSTAISSCLIPCSRRRNGCPIRSAISANCWTTQAS